MGLLPGAEDLDNLGIGIRALADHIGKLQNGIGTSSRFNMVIFDLHVNDMYRAAELGAAVE